MKRNGFTLIELLAVIVILAIIAVIAVPIVIDIIEDSKKNATLRSEEFYMDAVEKAIATKQLKGTENVVQDGIYEINEDGDLCLVSGCSEDSKIEVEIKGETPTNVTFVIRDSQIISTKKYGVEEKTVIMSAILQKETDEATGKHYAKVIISFDEYLNDGSIMYMLSELQYNKSELTYLEVIQGNAMPTDVNVKNLDASVSISTEEDSDVKNTGNYITIVFETNDLEQITYDDFSFKISALNSNEDITIKQNNTSDIKIVNGAISWTFAEKEKGKSYVPGDVNNDGLIDYTDAVYIQKARLDYVPLCKAMDVTGDGKINIKDLVRLKKILGFEDVELQYSPMTDIPDHL